VDLDRIEDPAAAGDHSPVQVDAAQVRRLIAAQFPRWSAKEVKPVPNPGVDNITFRLGDDMSVRMPRVARWLGQVVAEQRWLPRLAPHLPLPVPVPLAAGRPGEGYRFLWSVYRWLPGERADLGRIDDQRQTAVDMAEFLAALHRIDAAGGPPPRWSNGFRGVPLASGLDSAVVADRLRDRIAALDGLTDTDALTAVWQAGLDAPAWDGPPVWIHGDPAPGNLLVSGGRLSAVIDFGTAAVGDPACDLIAAWTLITDPAALETFRAALDVDDATWARGRVWGLTGALPTPESLTSPDPTRASAARKALEALTTDLTRD
jgi:aminoglycoside phosphotransferase (APT) family kinase protein